MRQHINSSAVALRGYYDKPAGAPAPFFNQTSRPIMQRCSNVNCHFRTTTPVWGAAPLTGGQTVTNCQFCHQSTGINTGNHTAHISYFGPTLDVCSRCHSNHTTFDHATSAGNPGSSIHVTFSGAPTGAGSYIAGSHAIYPNYYSTTGYGSCSSTYCHSTGKRGQVGMVPTVEPANPTWGGAALDCKGCHGAQSLPTSGVAFNSVAGEPNYISGAAGSASANSHQKHVGAAGAAACVFCHSKTTTDGITLIAGSQHLNTLLNYTAGGGKTFGRAANKTCSNISCHSGNGALTGVANAQWGSTIGCDICHPRAGLSGAHQFHIDSAAAVPPAYLNLTGNKSFGSKYNYGCSTCHPLNNANHANGTIVIDLRPIASSGSLRLKNAAGVISQATATVGAAYSGTVATTGISGTAGTSIICNNVYCHSNGGNSGGTILTSTTYYASPNWYGSITSTQDKCSMCHGNMPNSAGSWGARIGSPAHYNTNWLGYANVSSGHSLGFHDKNIYKGGNQNGLVGKNAGSPSAHGNPALATTFNCNACHYLTVTTASNDKNNVCVACHKSGGSASIKNPVDDMLLIANTAYHVNGALNINFRNMTGYVTPAQVRDYSYLNYSSSWRRLNGYKSNNSAEHWNPKKIPSYSGGTCSNIACHNGQSVNWGATGGTTMCQSCHTGL